MDTANTDIVKILLCIINVGFTLVLAFIGFVMKRIVDELDRLRDQNSELYKMCAEVKEEAARAEGKLSEKFVPLDVFRRFQDDANKHYERLFEKLDEIWRFLRKEKNDV